MRNPRLAQALKKSLENQGVKLFEHTPVTGMMLGEHAVHGILTEQGELKADRVVIAGGAWSAQLLESSGVTLPVRPVRGQMILYRAEPKVVQRIVLSRDRYVIPRRDGRILVGSTLEEVGFDKSTTRAAMQELRRLCWTLRAAPMIPRRSTTCWPTAVPFLAWNRRLTASSSNRPRSRSQRPLRSATTP